MARRAPRPAAPPSPAPRRAHAGPTPADLVLQTDDQSLLDLVDNVLSKGVVLSGDLTIALAEVDLVYARLSLLLCAADRVLPDEDTDFMARHQARQARRAGSGAAARRRPATPARPR